jgi:hypothetical protein
MTIWSNKGKGREMQTAQILNMTDACSLADIIRMAQGNKHVARLMDNGDVITGTARSIGTETGMFATETDDVRDMFLRVTTDMGWEAFWSVRELLPQALAGEFLATQCPCLTGTASGLSAITFTKDTSKAKEGNA